MSFFKSTATIGGRQCLATRCRINPHKTSLSLSTQYSFSIIHNHRRNSTICNSLSPINHTLLSYQHNNHSYQLRLPYILRNYSSQQKFSENSDDPNPIDTNDASNPDDDGTSEPTSEANNGNEDGSGVGDGDGDEKPKKKRRKKLKPRKDRKPHKEKLKDAEKRQIRREYKWFGAIIGLLFSMIGGYFYHFTGTDIGKADSYFKAALHAQMDEKDYETADEFYQLALKHSDYSFPKYVYDYALFLKNCKEDYPAAEEWMGKAINLHPTNAVYHRTFTELLEKMGEERAEEAKAQRKTTVNAHIMEANFFLSGDSLEELAANLMGHRLPEKKKSEKEKEAAKKRELDPGDWQAARMHMDYALNFARDDAELKTRVFEVGARMFFSHGYFDISQQYWDKGMKQYPDIITVKYAAFLYEQQNYEKAMQLLRIRLKEFPYDIMAMALQGKILMDIEQYRKALDTFSRMLVMAPMNHIVIGDMIMILIKMGQLSHARQLLNKTLQLMDKHLPENYEAVYLTAVQGYLYGKMDEIEEGSSILFTLARKHPDDFMVNYIGAKHFAENCDQMYDKADRLYRTALQIEDNWAFALYDYAMFLFARGDDASAKRYLTKAYDKNPMLPRVQDAYHRIFHS